MVICIGWGLHVTGFTRDQRFVTCVPPEATVLEIW